MIAERIGSLSDGLDVSIRIRALAGRLLPPYPDQRLIPQAVVPPPAFLRSGMRESQVLEFLAAGYRGAVWRRWKIRSSFLLKGDPKAHKSHAILVEAARKLYQAKISPGAWCLFSADAWHEQRPKSPPTVAWVYSANRLRDRQAWFRDEEDKYQCMEVRYSPAHRALERDWQAMWLNLIQWAPTTLSEVVYVIEKHFPDVSFEKRVAAAKTEVRQLQLTIDNAVLCGELPWS